MEGSTIDLPFTLIVSLWSWETGHYSIHYCFEFQLRIQNVSTTDIGSYTCFVSDRTRINVDPIRFLGKNDENIIYGQEGKTMNISCASITGYHVGMIYITQNGIIVAESDSNIVTFFFKPDRQDNSKEYNCMSVYHRVNVTVTIKLLVNHAPSVTVLLRVNMIYCFPDGFPDTYTFYKWEHQSENREHIRFLNGLENGTLILRTLPQQYQISGRYLCTVSNGIPDINGSLLQTNFTSYNYQGPPIFVPENRNVKFVELYKPITVTFVIYSNPIVEEIWIEGVAPCYTINEKIHDFRISETKLIYSEFGSKETVEGYEFAFEIKMFSNEYEMYKIWIKNRLGEDSFSFSIRAVGAPLFVRENRNVMHGELGEPLTLTFLLYSDPLVDDIWIQSVGTDCNQNRTKHEIRMSNTTLSYTAFGNRGNISGYEITIDTHIENSNDFRVYCICAKNELGLDFFMFEIKPSESGENNKKDRTGLITSSSIAASLLIYITVLHICLFVRHRMKRTRRGHIQEPLHYNTYDEIGSISYEAVNTRRLDSNQQGNMLPARIISSPQNESTTTTINYRPGMNVSTSSRISLQETQVNAARRSYNAETAIDTFSPLAIEEIRHSDGSCNEESFASTDDSLQSFQRRSHQDEHSSNSNKTSTCSSRSDESRIEANVTTSMGLNVGEGYENPYQIVIHENQGIHQYSSIINLSAGVDSARPTSVTDEQTTNVTDYVNLRL